MDTRGQTACAVAGLAGGVLLFVGLLVAGYLPPPPASLTADEVAAFYRDHTFLIRLGVLLILIGAGGWASAVSVVWVQLRRTPGPPSAMTALHLVTGVTGYVFLSLYGVLLAAAAFRPERAPEITQALHDAGWFMAFLAAVPFVVQAAAAGLAILGDRGERPVYPRWLGYTGIWVAIALAPGDILLFFHTGPFAYHGIISYWIPLVAFAVWWVGLSWCALRAARAELPAAATAGAQA